MIRAHRWFLAALIACGGFVTDLTAEVTDIQASVSAELTELIVAGDGSTTIGDTVEANDAYPTTVVELPMQVIVDLVGASEEAAAACGAQFADPRDLDQANPEEFAVNLALSSASATTRYEAATKLVERRSVIFHPDELNNRANGETATLVGTLFLDGVLALLGGDPGTDLAGVSVSLKASVVIESREPNDASEPVTVFTGGVLLKGQSGSDALTQVSGDFPSDRVLVVDLSNLATDFDAAHVATLPLVQLDYEYDVVVGRAYDIVVTLEIDAQNAEDGTAAVCLLGTPLNLLADVIAVTQGEATGKQVQAALLQERESPTGVPVSTLEAGGGIGGLCAPIGFTSLIGLMALTGAEFARTRRGGKVRSQK